MVKKDPKVYVYNGYFAFMFAHILLVSLKNVTILMTCFLYRTHTPNDMQRNVCRHMGKLSPSQFSLRALLLSFFLRG